MKHLIKSHNFWLGLAIGTVAGPLILQRVAPGLKKNLPGQ